MAFDPDSGRTRVLRLKENADDYRYFPDPDLVPLIVSAQQIEAVRRQLPELPAERRERLRDAHGLSEDDAGALTATRALADFFEAAASHHGSGRSIANWILRDVRRVLNEQERDLEASALTPEALAALVRLIDAGRTTARAARELLPELVERGGDPETLIAERGLEAVSDTGVLEQAVDAVIAACPEDVERYRAGEKKVLNFLMGQVMKQTQGKADPASIRKILAARIEGEGDAS